MIVTLDGQRLDVPFAPDRTLQALLDHVRATRLGQRVIVSVAVNGTRLDDEALRTGLDQFLGEDLQLDLESGDRRAVVRDALRGLALEFDAARQTHADLADLLAAGAAGDVAGAIRRVGEFVALWQACYRVLAQCNGLLGDDLTLYTHAGRPIRDWLEDLLGRFTELRQALASRDLVLLADLVRYELLPLCATWRDLLNDAAGQLDAP